MLYYYIGVIMTRKEFNIIQDDAKKWRKLKTAIDIKCQYSGTKSMLLPVLDLIKEIEKEEE